MLASFWPAGLLDGLPVMGMAIPDEATGNYTLMPLWIWVYCIVWWLIQDACKVRPRNLLSLFALQGLVTCFLSLLQGLVTRCLSVRSTLQPSIFNPPPSTLHPPPSTLNPQPSRWRASGCWTTSSSSRTSWPTTRCGRISWPRQGASLAPMCKLTPRL